MLEMVLKKLINETIDENVTICGMKQDICGIKQEIAEMKQDICGIKQEIAVMKQDIVVMKQDITELKSGFALMAVTQDEMKSDIKQILDGMRLAFDELKLTAVHDSKIGDLSNTTDTLKVVVKNHVNNSDIHLSGIQ